MDLKKYFLDKNLESMFGSKHAQINPKLLDKSSGNIVGSNDAQIKKPHQHMMFKIGLNVNHRGFTF